MGKRGKGLAAKKKNFFKALLRLEKKIPCVIELFWQEIVLEMLLRFHVFLCKHEIIISAKKEKEIGEKKIY